MAMFCPLSAADSTNRVKYEQQLPNSALSQRPLCLQMGTESVENMQSLALFNPSIESLKTEKIVVQLGNRGIQVQSEIWPYA